MDTAFHKCASNVTRGTFFACSCITKLLPLAVLRSVQRWANRILTCSIPSVQRKHTLDAALIEQVHVAKPLRSLAYPAIPNSWHFQLHSNADAEHSGACALTTSGGCLQLLLLRPKVSELPLTCCRGSTIRFGGLPGQGLRSVQEIEEGLCRAHLCR